MAACTLGAAAATGVSAQVGVIDTSGVRWVHHGLYAASIAACAMAALADLSGPGRGRGAMVPSLVGLAVLGRTDGGTVRHAAVASAAVCCAGIDLVRTR